jgi:hypothetical protein
MPGVTPKSARAGFQEEKGKTNMRLSRCLGVAIAAIFLGLTLGAARPAAAEWFLDLYGGVSITDDGDVELRRGQTLNDTVKLDDVATGGGRLGFYLDVQTFHALGGFTFRW